MGGWAVLLLLLPLALAQEEAFQCGSDKVQNDIAKTVVQFNCKDQVSAINKCCISHDGCYDKQGGRPECDLAFCSCVAAASNGNPLCGFYTQMFCDTAKIFGEPAYKKAGEVAAAAETEKAEKEKKETDEEEEDGEEEEKTEEKKSRPASRHSHRRAPVADPRDGDIFNDIACPSPGEELPNPSVLKRNRRREDLSRTKYENLPKDEMGLTYGQEQMIIEKFRRTLAESFAINNDPKLKEEREFRRSPEATSTTTEATTIAPSTSSSPAPKEAIAHFFEDHKHILSSAIPEAEEDSSSQSKQEEEAYQQQLKEAQENLKESHDRLVKIINEHQAKLEKEGRPPARRKPSVEEIQKKLEERKKRIEESKKAREEEKRKVEELAAKVEARKKEQEEKVRALEEAEKKELKEEKKEEEYKENQVTEEQDKEEKVVPSENGKEEVTEKEASVEVSTEKAVKRKQRRHDPKELESEQDSEAEYEEFLRWRKWKERRARRHRHYSEESSGDQA